MWQLLHRNTELFCWVVALLVIFFSPMAGPSLCIFDAVGMNSCPGCGIAHAMKSAMHLDLIQSFREHPFGIPAVIVLCYRVYVLTFGKFKLNAEQKFHNPGSLN